MSSDGSTVSRDTNFRVAHILHSLAPAGGGTSVSVPALCTALGEHDIQTTLHVTNAGNVEPPLATSYRLRVHPCLPGTGGGRLGVAPSLHTAMAAAGHNAHIVHSHGLWLFANVDVYWATRGSSARLVLSPRGMLEPVALKRRSGLKRLVWLLGQGTAARAADCIHVTADSEYESVRAAGLRAPIAVIPNGVALPAIVRERPRTGHRRLLFLGRLDRIKGIEFLLRAWSRVAAEFPHWEVRIVGPSFDHHEQEMKALAERLGAPRVTFLPGVFGEARDRELADADLFVLPTLSENFAMTVAEALASATPVLCSKGAPWARLGEKRCGRWIDIGTDPLAAGLREMLSLPDAELREMGQRGRTWMAQDFSWSTQAKAMKAVYRWLSSGGERPACVRLH